MATIENEEKLSAETIWALFKETDKRFQRTERLVNKLSKYVGGLNNKFGSFTEGLFMPSLKRIFKNDLGLTNFHQNAFASIGSNNIEIDVLAYSNGVTNIAYIVEIKSHLKIEHIQQILNIISKFKSFYPEHKDKKICGMIAAITFTNDLKEEVLSAGLYFAQIHNKTFQIDVPENFQPKYFN